MERGTWVNLKKMNDLKVRLKEWHARWQDAGLLSKDSGLLKDEVV